jgi:Leucine-rich repeat (LRR) protein
MPESIGRLTNLATLYLDTSHLSGTLPSSLCLLKSLGKLDLSNNNFRGRIPQCDKGHLPDLEYLYLNDNGFTGAIPPSIMYLKSLVLLSLKNNLLSSSVPQLSGLTNARIIRLDNNFLSGNINWNLLGPLPLVEVLTLGNNLLSGGLPANAEMLLPSLRFLNVFNNKLTGSLPPDLFSVHLEGIILSLNCFTGTIPVTICDAQNVKFLLMDGLSSASFCSKDIWGVNPFGFDGRIATNRVRGSIPSCIFDFRNLESLHLSGNSLNGSRAGRWRHAAWRPVGVSVPT